MDNNETINIKNEFVSFQEVDNICKVLSKKIKVKYKRALIIMRGGVIPGVILCRKYLQIPIIDFIDVGTEYSDEKKYRTLKSTCVSSISSEVERKQYTKDDFHMLIIDDVVEDGITMRKVLKKFKQNRFRKSQRIDTLALFIKPWTSYVPTYYYKSTVNWVIWDWEVTEENPLQIYRDVNKIDLSWLGGVIDGEGCLHVSKIESSGGSTITITNTLKDIIVKVKNILDCMGIRYSLKTVLNMQHCKTLHSKYYRKWVYTIYINGYGNMLKFLFLLKPYIIGKKEEVDIMMTFCKESVRNSYKIKNMQLLKKCHKESYEAKRKIGKKWNINFDKVSIYEGES